MNNNQNTILHNGCIIHGMTNILIELGDNTSARHFKTEAKRYFGINNLAGLPTSEQINKMNRFLRSILEVYPNTTFVRAWLENGDNLNEYLYLFKNNWAKDIIQLGVFSHGK